MYLRTASAVSVRRSSQKFYQISLKQAHASDPLYFFKIYQAELPDIRQFLHIKKSFQMPGKRQIQSQTQLISPPPLRGYMFWIESIHHWALKMI